MASWGKRKDGQAYPKNRTSKLNKIGTIRTKSKMRLALKKANKPFVNKGLPINPDERGRMTDSDYERLLMLNSLVKQNIIQVSKKTKKAIRMAVLDEDSRRTGSSEAEIRLMKRMTSNEKMDAVLYALKKIDPNATATIIVKQNGKFKPYDLFKMKGFAE